jgi:hypothetical protein
MAEGGGGSGSASSASEVRVACEELGEVGSCSVAGGKARMEEIVRLRLCQFYPSTRLVGRGEQGKRKVKLCQRRRNVDVLRYEQFPSPRSERISNSVPHLFLPIQRIISPLV